MDISKVKLIIWDLDETFWQGVLSDNTVVFDDANAKLIVDTTDSGVINAICSKNEYESVKEFMSQHGLWEYFVFNSINWSPKGERVKQIISEMNLRDANVLFIDDNHLNLQEVKQACPSIMVALPDIIPELKVYFEKSVKKDLKHARLNQYKILEKKTEFKAAAGSNEEFLYDCNIQVKIQKDDCVQKIERIYDLVQRSNQLNFTKLRSSKEDLLELLNDSSVDTGYVEVNDKFGDYGIVGFFAIKNNVALHFVFSCRTLNMGVEQYVYNFLNMPTVNIVGEVASNLAQESPKWINRKTTEGKASKDKISNVRLLIKGPCDLELVFSFIEDSRNIIKEFVYVGKNGVSIEGACHTVHIVESLTLDKEIQNRVVNSLPFGDAKMFDTAIFNPDVDIIYLSLFTDPNLGLYREKRSGAIVAFGEWINDLTDENKWPLFVKGKLFTSNCKFTFEQLKFIKENYEFLGRILPEETVKNLDYIYSHISPKAKLVLNLGSEIEYIANTQPAYADRHIYHQKVNNLIREWQNDKENVYLIELSKYINSQSDYTNNINHFSKIIYRHLACELLQIAGTKDIKVRTRQKSALWRKMYKAWRLLMTKVFKK